MVPTVFLIVFHVASFAQADPGKYFRLDVRRYQEGQESYLGVSPEVRSGVKDALGTAIQKNPRRFRYILSRVPFQNKYEQYYPDSLKINQLFAAALLADTNFMAVFRSLADPITRPGISRKHFTRSVLLRVAARFFYCDGLNADSSIRSFICINLNGVKTAGFSRGMAMLEAFCFEAIFENYRDKTGRPNQFVANFKTAVAEAEQRFKHLRSRDPNKYIGLVRNHCFEKMEKDTVLMNALYRYWEESKAGWGFVIR